MNSDWTRRGFLGAAAAASLATTANASFPTGEDQLRIVAVSCSPRQGKTTTQGLQIALDAAKQVAPDRIQTELIELAGLAIPGSVAAGVPLAEGQEDDFPQVAASLGADHLAGLIVGSPVYFGTMSSLGKAFLERCGMFRKDDFALSNTVGGALAVGGARNGGQELTVQAILSVLMCHEMLIVGDGRPTGHRGATLWNDGKDDISRDEYGVKTAKNLGRRIAEVALLTAE